MLDVIVLKLRQIDWADTEAKHKKKLQKAIVRTRMDTTHEVLRRMRPQIFHIIATLYNDLELSYRSKRERMIADFNQIMRYPRVTRILYVNSNAYRYNISKSKIH